MPNSNRIFINFSETEFADRINNYYIQSLEKNEKVLQDGYAPFCKHIFIKNFTDTKPGSVEITPENESFIRTKYEARTELELPVLRRYFPKEKVILIYYK